MDNFIGKEAVQLAYVNSLFTAVNKSCRQMNDISYTSGGTDDERVLSPFETFLCKLAQICDTKKGGDTITGMVALKGNTGPTYLFAQNNRKEMELESAKTFLKGILTFVSTNPDGLGGKAMQKAVLWRILEFNFPRIKFYLNQVEIWIEKCIGNCNAEPDSIIIRSLREIQTKSDFPREITAGDNPKFKFLKDCEALIKAIHVAKETGVSEGINRFASATESATSHPWYELRHYLGRLHSYRLAAETIVKASSHWPELFRGFNVEYIPSSRTIKVPLMQPAPSMMKVIQISFPDMDLEEYMEQIEALEDHGLRDYLQDELRHKSLRQFVHCEVHLHDFLILEKKTDPSQYWNNSIFIATSKPPCRLCHYYFSDMDNDFEVQSSHMNVYPRWRLPSIGEEQGNDARERQKEVIEDLIEQMQQDTLLIVRQNVPQGKRNDSRTESRGLITAMSSYEGEGSDIQSSGLWPATAGRSSRGSEFDIRYIPSKLNEDFNFVGAHDVGAAV